MALNKTIKTHCGIEGDYIKISSYKNNSCNLLVWLNKESKDLGFEHLPYGEEIKFPIDLLIEDKIKEEGKSQLVLIYEYLKTLPEFLGSEDC